MAETRTDPEAGFGLKGQNPNRTQVCQVVNRWDPKPELNRTDEQSKPNGSGWVQILKPDPNLSIGLGQVLHKKLYLAVLVNYKVPKKC